MDLIMKNLKLFLPVLLIFAVSGLSCSVYQTMVNISRLKFKLGVVNNLTLGGVNLSSKKSINDLSIMEALKLTETFAKGSMPATFTLNVNALNPNDGTGGYPQTNATIVAFPWRLMINNKETVSGDIGSPFSVPGTGQVANIPILITVDLYKFFKDNTYQDIINLALKLNGSGSTTTTTGSTSDLALYVKPVVSSPIGNISYPQEIKVINYEYSK
jgi:hypothetical protein